MAIFDRIAIASTALPESVEDCPVNQRQGRSWMTSLFSAAENVGVPHGHLVMPRHSDHDSERIDKFSCYQCRS